MTCTQKRLAELAGISQKTVNLSLRNAAEVNSQTRQRVQSLAARHGYRLNAAASAMRKGCFGAVGLVLSTDRARSAMSRLTQWAIETELRDRDTLLTLGEISDDLLIDPTYVPQILRRWAVDGLLISYSSEAPATLTRLLDHYHLPRTWINCKHAENCVYPDDWDAGHRATGHLLAMGHRRIAYVFYGGHNPHYSTTDRQAGYLAAMNRAGLTPQVIRSPERMVAPTILDFSRQWLRPTDRPTAVVAYSRREALPIAQAAAIEGLCIPRDLSLVTVHDEPVHDSGLDMTTMLIPVAELGQQAVAMLMDQIAAPSKPLPPCILKTTLSPGATCAPAYFTHRS